MRFISLCLAIACGCSAQSEDALKRYFEGKQVRVKIDMPGTHHGIDLYYKKDPPVDFKTYSQRLKNFGVALRDGDTVRVTTIHVKNKNIEFQLNGGGYGTFGDDSGSVYLPSVTKSSRESSLERDLKNETDSRRRDDMNRELSRLRDTRQREERYRRERQIELETIKKREILEKRRDGGSRFNLWFPPELLAEAIPTPDLVMKALSDYVDFSPMTGSHPTAGYSRTIEAPAPPPAPPQPATPDRLRRGLTREQVHGMLGKPQAVKKRQEGQLEVETETFEDNEDRTEVDFVSGVVVKFRVNSK
jgi:hypothetical protein